MIAGNHYQLLGVAPTASQEEIKKAYRSLSKQYHPDMYPGDKKKEEVFQLISEAYAVLSNAEKRKAYDNSILLNPKRQKKTEKGNSNKKASFYSADGFNPQNMAASFADFWGFSPGQDLSSMKNKKKENSINPMDVSDLFNRYMGIRK